MIFTQPFILEETENFAVVFKPPKMHSSPLKENNTFPYGDQTLFEWYAEQSPHPKLMHRLDFETHGLLLFAKNSGSYNFFNDLQERGGIVKEYSAICSSSVPGEGFPPPPDLTGSEPSPNEPLVVESYFRPYGPGRKLVRPVTGGSKKHEIAKNRGGYYRTEITGINSSIFTVRIRQGFRHQIRCHLCWIGCPVLNDPLYSNCGHNSSLSHDKRESPVQQGINRTPFKNNSENTILALRAHALFFADPASGEQREYHTSPMIP